ncbi:carbohydrate ABC transporter permease [Candidatus Aerophobetes bacterium]|nr:carbohydrate ABC transporter permease [Candidatus Aerophobetes bacterium]
MKVIISPRKNFRTILVGKYLLLFILSVLSLFPIFWLIITSIKMEVDIFARPPLLIFRPTIQHYVYVLKTGFFGSYFLNSLSVALFTTFFSIIIGGLGAYSLARFKFYGDKLMAFLILSFRMLPPVALVIPMYLLARKFGLANTKLSLIIAYTAFNLPFVTWMLRSYLDNVPVEVEEASMIDGASRMSTLVRITLPLSLPGIFATAIFCFLLSWNEFIFALSLTSSPKAQTLPVAVSGFISARGIAWGELSASTFIMLLPAFLFGVFAQRYIIKGLIPGAIK